jgi:hypothetical protein
MGSARCTCALPLTSHRHHCSLFTATATVAIATAAIATALHCTALHCTALHCTALHCTAPTASAHPTVTSTSSMQVRQPLTLISKTSVYVVLPISVHAGI